MIPEKIAFAVFGVVLAQLLSAIAILVLAFTAPRYIPVALNAFGFFTIGRSGFFVIYGLAKGDLSSARQPATRNSEPMRFWARLISNLMGVGIGIFLMLLPIGSDF